MHKYDNTYSQDLPLLQEAEYSTVGALMIDNEAFPKVAHILKPEYFHHGLCRMAFNAISAQAAKGLPWDIVTLSESPLMDQGMLADLATMAKDTPSSANVVHYANLVVELYQRRQFVILNRKAEERAKEKGTNLVQLAEEYKEAINNVISINHSMDIVSAAEINEMIFPPTRWIIPGIIPVGSTLFAGAPKVGKSWLALDIALAVSMGATMFDNTQVDPGPVLYLALEDNLKRLQLRMRKLSIFAPPENLYFATTWGHIDSGCIEHIRRIIEQKLLRLVVIDTLAAIRPPVTGKENPYMSDYRIGQALLQLAHETECAILVLHHTNKGHWQSPFDRISGTTGLQGSFDNLIVLNKEIAKEDVMKIFLHVTGRDVEESCDYELMWIKSRAKFLMTTETIYPLAMSPERQEVYAIVKEHGPITARAIAEMLNPGKEIDRRGKEIGRISFLLNKLKAENLVVNVDTGYILKP